MPFNYRLNLFYRLQNVSQKMLLYFYKIIDLFLKRSIIGYFCVSMTGYIFNSDGIVEYYFLFQFFWSAPRTGKVSKN